MKNKWLRILIVLFILLFCWRVYNKITSTSQDDKKGVGPRDNKGKQAVAVEIGKIKTMNMSEMGTFSGNLIPKNGFIVAPKISGQLKKLRVNIGDTVKKGQLLAELDDRIYRQDYEKAKAALEIAKANAEQTKNAYEISVKELANQKSLYQKGFISKDEFDQYNLQYISNKAKNDVAQATVSSNKATLKSAEIELSYTKIIADWSDSGKYRVVGERFIDEGSMLTTNTSIVSIVDISTIIAVIDIIESDYTKIRIGQKAVITTDSYPNQQFNGRIARIAPVLQEASRQARVEIEINNVNSKLKPGMFAKVQLTYQQKKNITAIPAAALCKNMDKQGIFLVDKITRKVHFIEIEAGIQNNDFIEVVTPKIHGDVVILGQDQLEDGKKIILPKAERGKSRKSKMGE